MKPQLLRTAALLCILFFSKQLIAQNNVLGGWYIANFNYNFNKKFILYSEAQIRSQHFANDFFYHELKAGVSYNFSNKSSFLLGFGNYETYTFPGNLKKPLTANEFRIWQQYIMVTYLNRVKVEHRYRFEERWINGDYFTRMRYRLNPIVPLNHSTLVKNTFYIPVFDEVFFTNKAPYFIRNRFFAGVGYQFSKTIALQSGFIRQFDYRKSDDGSGKNFIQTLLIINAGNPNRAPHHSDTD